MYWHRGLTEVDYMMGSIYSADPSVDRHHLISISSYHSMKMHTLCFPTFGRTRSARDFLDPHNCMDTQHRVVSYLLSRFLPSSNKNCYWFWIQFGCREWCCIVLMVGSLPSSSIVLPQRPPSGVSLSSRKWRVRVFLQLCSTTIRGQIHCMYVYSDLNNACHITM